MKKKNIIICLVLLILFIIDMVLVCFNKMRVFDNSIYNFIMSIRCDFFDNFFILITKLGNTKTIILIIFLFVLIKRNKNSLLLPVLAILSSFSMRIIKYIVKRPRPNILRLIVESNYSFPSGHAMISICVYGYLIYYFYHHINNKILRNIICTMLGLLILLIGISRIYVGVHYPSDVLGGYLLASVILIIITDKFEKNTVKGC